jgi:acyl-[acyl-carrier-protein]-UDP-N-acetylglucosamine O-acyltransferase
MEGMHVAHDVCLGSGCIIGNSTKIAGEVEIDDFAVISANVLIHQFCHIGSYVMVGGGTRTGQDVPPYTMAAREPVAYCGLNLVGLRRHGFSSEVIEQIHEAYRLYYNAGMSREESFETIKQKFPESKEVEYIIDFIKNSKRGVIK